MSLDRRASVRLTASASTARSIPRQDRPDGPGAATRPSSARRGLGLFEDVDEVLELALGPVAEAAELGVDVVAQDHHRRGDQQARAGGPEGQADVGGQGRSG